MIRKLLLISAAFVCVITLTSCGSTRVINTGIQETNIEKDYVFYNRMPNSNAQDTFIVLVFSGGGTRSSAFAYGVLEKLRDTPIMINGESRQLLDEVDVISAVSGGSYTAAYYGLFGKRIFRDFEDVFLNRDVQSEMINMLYNPLNLIKISSGNYNRGDLAAQWLNSNIFENKTFSNMSNGQLPFVILNASDLNTGMTFSFIQQQFDYLCSDISSYPIANAVMASSSVPGLFAPITLVNYATECAQKTMLWHSWVKNSLSNDSIYDRSYQVARALSRYYQPANMPKVRLVDGGVTDNLGVRGSIMNPVAHYGKAIQMSGAFSADALKKVKRVLVIVANAQTYVDYKWSKDGDDPGFIDTMDASFSSAMGILNTETITQARNSFTKWQEYTNAQRPADTPKVKVYFSTLTFSQISDLKKRDYFNEIPTSFRLKKQYVTSVRALAGELLEKSVEFQAFKNSIKP